MDLLLNNICNIFSYVILNNAKATHIFSYLKNLTYDILKVYRVYSNKEDINSLHNFVT